jgi:spore coat polysaccharide biosynthesis protein SpsF (cytidylyltransferase family)
VLGRIHDAEQISRSAVVGSNAPSTLPPHEQRNLNFLATGDAGLAQRLLAAADKHEADWVVYVPVNCPFVDPVLIDLLVSKARRSADCDYVGYYSPSGGSRRSNQLGLAAEVCHVDALRRLRRLAESDELFDPDASLIERLQAAPGEFHLQLVPLPEALDREDLRFVVADESDWQHADLLSEAVLDENTEWQPLATLVASHPQICRDMQNRNRVCPR